MASGVRVKVMAAIAAALCACAVGLGIAGAGAHPSAPAAPSAQEAAGDSSASPAAAAAAGGPSHEPGVVLATLAEGATPEQAVAELAAMPALAGIALDEVVGETVVKLALPEGVSVEDAAAAAAGASTVDAAQPNHRLYTQETADLVAAAITAVQSAIADDPAYAEGRQWGLDSVNAPDAWETALDAAATTGPVTVAVIDAGFYVNHADLIGNVVDQHDATARDAAAGGSIQPDNPVRSQVDHGTHAAGIAGARTNNGEGVAGVGYNLCNVLPVRIEDADGYIYDDYLAKAYDYVIARAEALNIRVVNMSLGGASATPVTRESFAVLYDQIAKAREAGIVTVVAACNSGTKDDAGNAYAPPFYAYPSDFDNVVSVIALNNAGSAADNGVDRMGSSNYNVAGQRAKHISAPGNAIYGLYGGEGAYGSKSGTSMSAPFVAGVMGLMFRVNPGLTVDQATKIVYGTARDLTQGGHMGAGWDLGSGYGEVDAAAAVSAAARGIVPEPESIAIDIGKAQVALSSAQLTYNGKVQKPTVASVTVAVDGVRKTLAENIDFTVSNPGVRLGAGTVAVTGTGAYTGTAKAVFTITMKKVKVYQLYNKKTGQWFYTASSATRLDKLKSGWKSKGVAWKAPSESAKAVYYQKKSGKIRYTTARTARGIAFYSDDYKTRPVYRYYNAKTKAYRYTTAKLKSSSYKRKATLFYAL